jgi:hypothetical protein
MMDSMVAHDIDDRRVGTLCVVQIRKPVGKARPQMQQRGRRLVGHARIAVGSPGDDTFEHAKHAPHLRFAIEGRNEVHLGCTRIGEACIDSAGQQGVAKSIGAVHREPSGDAMNTT